MMNLIKHLPEIIRRIVQVSDPEKIILFGSYARGNFNSDSDLDLLVIVPTPRPLRGESIRIRRVLRGLLVPVDIIVVTSEQIRRLGGLNGMIYKTALNEGKVLYERER